MFGLMLWFFLIALPALALAGEVSPEVFGEVKSGFDYYSTSDQFILRNLDLGYRGHREVGTLLLDANVLSQSRAGDDATGVRLLGGLTMKFGPTFTASARLGVHELRELKDPAATQRTMVGGLSVKGTSDDERLVGSFELKRDYGYSDLQMANGRDPFFTAWSFRPVVTWRLAERVRVGGRGAFSLLSDDNSRGVLAVDAMYGISPSSPWIWVGVGSELYHYGHKSTNYWSPVLFQAHGPRVEVSVPLYGEGSVLVNLAGNLVREEQLGSPWGRGYAILVGYQHGPWYSPRLRLTYSKIGSVQELSQWSGDEFMASFTFPL